MAEEPSLLHCLSAVRFTDWDWSRGAPTQQWTAGLLSIVR